MSDFLSSCLASINYGCSGNRTKVSVIYSDISLAICKLLYRDGWISSYSIVSSCNRNGLIIDVYFKFFDNKKVLSGIQILSTPGRSFFISHKSLCEFRKSDHSYNTFYILSTNRGIISSEDAFFLGIGGRILCRLYD